MKILGIRTAPKQIRYSLVEGNGNAWTLLNKSCENLIRMPATLTECGDQLRWWRDELHRGLRQNSGIEKIGLKTAEFRGADTLANRHGSYFDAMVLLVAAETGIPAIPRLYSQLATKRADVLRHAEARVGRSDSAWNEQMADAVAVAWVIGQ